MTEAPEKIWAYAGSFKMWRDHKTNQPHTQTEYTRSDIAQAEADTLRAEVARLKAAHGNLWSALADVMEQPGDHPNATVRRMAACAEKALVHDTIAAVQPVPRFYKITVHI